MTDVRAIQSGKANDAFAYIGKKNGECLAVFRGTSDLAGWLEDLKSASLVDLKDYGLGEICSFNGTTCKVGDGFMDNYNSVATFVKGNLTEIGCTTGSQLSITGHSLGAAEAAIAMFDLKHEGYDIVETYTFGQPRVGDEVFARAYEAAFGQTSSDTNAWRVTHADDPVPHLPFEFMGFTHISTEVWYESTTAKGYKVCDGSGEDPTCSNSKSDLVPVASATCATDQAKCANLNYMTDSKTISMSGESCTERSQTVSI
jgi:predicted lipase